MPQKAMPNSVRTTPSTPASQPIVPEATPETKASEAFPYEYGAPLTFLNHLEDASRMLDEITDTPKFVPPVLSVIIPVFNEVKTIEQVVRSVMELDVTKQIIIVDDGSTDGTRNVLAQFENQPGIELFLHSTNQGKGAALQNGIRLSIGDIVIVQDADLEYNPREILNVIEPIREGHANVVYGSRYLGDEVHDQSLIHRIGNATLTGLSNLMTRQKLTDMETCYKAFRRELLQSITIEQRRFGFEPEITAKIARRGIRIAEVPITYQSRSWNEGKKIGIMDLFSTLWCIIRYRFG